MPTPEVAPLDEQLLVGTFLGRLATVVAGFCLHGIADSGSEAVQVGAGDDVGQGNEAISAIRRNLLVAERIVGVPLRGMGGHVTVDCCK